MAVGITLSSDIVAHSQAIYEAALYTLKATNDLVRTIAVYTGEGMQARKVTRYTAANPRMVAEGEDVVPTKFSDALLGTLTPARYADTFLLTDAALATGSANMLNIRADAALELGSSFAQYVDVQIASNFGSMTGGTVGTAGSALSWNDIFEAEAILIANKVPKPYTCAVHPYQYLSLYKEALSNGNNAFSGAPQFQDNIVNRVMQTTMMDGVFFVRTPSIAVSGSNATGAMYSRLAMAYDERRAFNIRPQRDESREAWELNASLWFAHGAWDPSRGVQIISDATSDGV